MNREIVDLCSGRGKPKEVGFADYLRENSGVTNKPQIARELHTSCPTVQWYYDEVMTEFRRLG